MPSEIHKSDKDLFTVQDWQEWKPPPVRRIISDGVLDVGGKLQIFGGEGSWKSGLAIHLAYSVATGRRWMGFRTSPANVIYIVAEGGKLGIKSRIEKYCSGAKDIYLSKPGNVPDEMAKVSSIAYPSNVVTRYIDILHLDEHAGAESLKKNINLMIQSFPALPILVIVDPLYKVFGHDLTNQNDFNKFAEHMDLILYDYNQPDIHTGYQKQLALVVIHHPRKEKLDDQGHPIRQGSNESFGPRQLSWWFDAVLNTNLIESDKTKTKVHMEFTKYGRNTEGLLPEYIDVRWDKETLHPLILDRPMPKLPEDDIEFRGATLLEKLE